MNIRLLEKKDMWNTPLVGSKKHKSSILTFMQPFGALLYGISDQMCPE